ncbi:50S ribosomal protein L11 methyltransferase [Cyclobacterium jeungdonense]|uniref:Ribosomal protein L11 methyltransferase n=1 Tax=Cyclobacterium jeungdonense TaxID=708087 RepID=A0ABT8CD52_9BACT|nr:50S ribosomal protein L11 methyltransferase [Cyclobacterium jeungdonense]MDN3689733.1 50S ribosomal protein L11 methyltransferase [Cyclobacterium jeungdonense]
MEYLDINISCKSEYKDILIAEMADIGFDAFLETETGFDACILSEALDSSLWKKFLRRYKKPAQITVRERRLPKMNWNEEWEKNYDPISLAKKVYVRATFHPSRKDEFIHEIIINPKMSFGTGHHATTFLMLEWMLTLDLQSKKVMDAGSGTGILAIMAKKLGAEKVIAFDIDEWSVENGNENFEINGMSELRMQKGTISTVEAPGQYDLILANINKNVLLEEIKTYSQKLAPGGQLLLSGFYEGDCEDIRLEADLHNLKPVGQKINNHWAAMLFTKTP